METFLAALLTISAGVWVGAIVFQSAVVAPSVFVDLDTVAILLLGITLLAIVATSAAPGM